MGPGPKWAQAQMGPGPNGPGPKRNLSVVSSTERITKETKIATAICLEESPEIRTPVIPISWKSLT